MNLEPSGIEAQVCADIARRQQLGIAKYGVTVAQNPLSLREWLEHAYQECLDQAVYLKRAMEEIDERWKREEEKAEALLEAIFTPSAASQPEAPTPVDPPARDTALLGQLG